MHNPFRIYHLLSSLSAKDPWEQQTGRGGATAATVARAPLGRKRSQREAQVCAWRLRNHPHPAPRRPGRRSGAHEACGDSRRSALGERRHRVHGHRGGSVFLGPQSLQHGRGPQLLRSLLQRALPHPARFLRAGLAAAHELSVLLRRRLGDPQHPLAGTHLVP